MKVVLDTNVLMSALFFGGLPGRILQAWKEGRVSLLVSPAILEEYQSVAEDLARQYGAAEAGGLLAFLTAQAEVVEAPALPEAVSRDSEDDKFLACARSGGAAVVVSGDGDLLSLGTWEGIPILSPRQFADAHLEVP